MSAPLRYILEMSAGGELLRLNFIAGSDANAATIAQSVATLFACDLVLRGGTLTTFTKYTHGSQSSPGTVTSVAGVSLD